MTQTWHVTDEANLQQVLRRVNLTVPGRADGRTKEHTERFSVARLLATIATELKYPFALAHEDRPDFVLKFPASQTGIEHTEVIPENVARASFLREKGYGPSVHFLPRAIFGERRKSAQELKSEILRDEPSGGWYGNAPERETASAIVGFAQHKSVAAQKRGYRRFDANWLLMYNNWPAPAVDFGEAIAIAHKAMVAQGCFDTFDRVYVVGSSELAVTDASRTQIIKLVDPGIEC